MPFFTGKHQVVRGVVLELLSLADVTHVAAIFFPFFMLKVIFEGCFFSGDLRLKQLLLFIVLG